jgi:hypothetical protein
MSLLATTIQMKCPLATMEGQPEARGLGCAELASSTWALDWELAEGRSTSTQLKISSGTKWRDNMTLSTLRETAAEKAAYLDDLNAYIKLIEDARRAVEEADLFAWRTFEKYEDYVSNETSPYSLSFIISELGAIGAMLNKKKGGGE